MFDGLVTLDHRLAAARMAAELRAVLPELAEDGGHELSEARHPLLVLSGTEVVPNDIAIAPGEALVVAGPNAGGKTVAMKTLGLCVLMAHAGLFVPARFARIRLTRGVFCELGDEQSLALSLSSFSAHVSHLSRTLRAMGPGDLVLIDELAGGTDPAEGAALAVAVTRHLVSAGVAAVVTTHYEPLKRLSDRDPRVRRASMGMDPTSLEPTYRLHRGELGTSAALHVAEHYGLPREVVADARGELPQAYLDSQERLARIEELHARAERDATEAASGKRDVEEARAKLVEELAKARQREHESIREEVAGLWRQVHALRDELRTARKYLRETRRPTAEVVRKVEEKVGRPPKLGPAGPVETVLRGEAPGRRSAGALRGGRHGLRVRWGGGIQSTPGRTSGDRLLVRSRRVSFGDLRRVKRGASGDEKGGRGSGAGGPGKKGKGGKESVSGARRVAAAADVWLPRTEATTIDLRGLRVDEALDRLDEQLDRMFQAEAGTVWVIHGHGTGAVRKAVRAKLREHPLVSEWRPGEANEGGDGVSLLRLK